MQICLRTIAFSVLLPMFSGFVGIPLTIAQTHWQTFGDLRGDAKADAAVIFGVVLSQFPGYSRLQALPGMGFLPRQTADRLTKH